MRIAYMVIRLIFEFPFWILKMNSISKKQGIKAAYEYVRSKIRRINRTGKIEIESFGLENLPEKDGFVITPNHQGMFDVLAFIESCEKPFSFVYKKELENTPCLKNVFKSLNAIPMDRKDLRQSMRVIQEMTKRVTEGENFIIFAEGTRSKMGNKMLPMKAGSFKSAVKAKAPIVPCALVDSFKPFDEKSLKKVTVKVYYLEPLYYDEYKDMTTQEIAEEVKRRITVVLDANS